MDSMSGGTAFRAAGCVMTKPLSLSVALTLSGSLYGSRRKPKTLVFDEVLGMPIISIQTSQGKRRFVLDTGSNISTMDVKTQKKLRVSVAGKQFTVQFKPTQTHVFDEFEAMLPPAERVDGILGSDFMRHFRRVTFDFKGCLVSFE
jgi:hypothetical protein